MITHQAILEEVLNYPTELVEMPESELNDDIELYVRHDVDEMHVKRLAEALEFGAQLPPLRADKKTKILTDGWHRQRAYRRVHGEGSSVPVELVTYPNKKMMRWDASYRNNMHGKPLSEQDRRKVTVLLRQHGFSDDDISTAIASPVKVVVKYSQQTANVTTENAAGVVAGTKQIALKHSCRQFAGKTMTKKQAEAHDSAPGTSYLLIVNQLIDAIECEILDWEDESLVARLSVLSGLLKANVPK